LRAFKTHIVCKISAIFLAVVLLMPLTVKLLHSFSEDNNYVYKSSNNSHFHKLKKDCEICKFKICTHYNFETEDFRLLEIEENRKVYVSQYFFLPTYQKLHFSKRGPPQWI